MNDWSSLSTLYTLAEKVDHDKIIGDVVECGCCNGGAGAMTTAFLSNRRYWLFDSFEGLPKPSSVDVKNDDGSPAQALWREGWDKGTIENVKQLYFDKLRVKKENLFVIKGLFQDVLPKYREKIKKIALLHLDGDWYESTKVCLENLFDKVESGGYVMIDDYGHWKGCKNAVDEFFEKRKIKPELLRVDYTRVYFKK